MKKFLLPVLVVGLIIGVATVVWATVIGTPHDLAPETCAMCHSPHNGTGQYPLWNRTQAAQTYTVYDSPGFDMGPATQPREPSSLCLVCHNGIASELVNYPGPCSNPDSMYDITVAGGSCGYLGTDLTNEHPISFNYNANADQDGNDFPTATRVSDHHPSIHDRKMIRGNISDTRYMLYGNSTEHNWFECATCHSVHDLAEYPGKGSYQVYFLRSDNSGSQMCLDCHTKR